MRCELKKVGVLAVLCTVAGLMSCAELASGQGAATELNGSMSDKLKTHGMSDELFTSDEPEFYAKRGMQYAEEYPGLASLCDLNAPIKDYTQKGKAKMRAAREANAAKQADAGVQSSVGKQHGKQNESKRSSKNRSKSIEPTQVFDNLYYVGTGGVASWVLSTSDGLIVIDALNNNEEAQKYIENGLYALGLNPQDIKYLLITHGHGDHYGGQDYLVNKYHPQVVMMETEWDELEKPVQEFQSSRWGEPPSRDVSVVDGEQITLGDTMVTLYETPGHTPGTMSLVFPVYDGDKRHLASLWGGTGLNYGSDADRIATYTQSAGRFVNLVDKLGVDVFLSNHPTRDGTAERMPKLNQRMATGAHPFVVGTTEVRHGFELLRDCTYAQVLRIEAE